MITSFEVGSVFRIADMATPTILKISERLSALSKELKGVEERFAAFGKMNAKGLNQSLTSVGKHLTTLAEKSKTTQEALSANFGKADVSIDHTISAVGRLKTALGEARTEAAGIGRLLPKGSGGGGGSSHSRPGSSGHGGRGVAHLGYGGLGVSVGSFIGAEVVGHGLYDVIKQASELRHVQEQMLQGGFAQAEVAKSLAESWKVAGKYGIDVAKVMGDIKELRTPFGSTEHAIDFIDPLERMRVVLDAVSEGSGTNARESVFKMARAGELKGLNNASEYLQYFDSMTKVISATGGKVGPNDFMQATKYARLSAMGFNKEYYTEYLPTLIQSLGASGAGTANAALFGTLVQGKASERSVKAIEEIGLIGDKSRLRKDKHGNTIGFASGAIVDTDLLTANPLEWVRKDLLPRLEKKFGDLSVEANKLKAIDNLGDFFGNRMSAQAVGEMAFRLKSFDRDRALLQGAKGLDGVEDLQKNDPDVAAKKLVGAWDNLLKALGGPLVDPAVKAMNALSSGLTELAKLANDHPEVVKNVGAALAGLAVGLGGIAAAGVLAAAAALAPGGLIAVAVTTIGTMIGSLAALHWDTVAGGLRKLWDAVKGLFLHGDADDWARATPGAYTGPSIAAGGLINAAYTGGANDNSNVGLIAAGTKSGFIDAMQSLGTSGGGSALGGNIIRASFGGGGSFGGAGRFIGGGTGVNTPFSNSAIEGVRQYIRAKAASLGIDPNIAERVARSEGLNSTLGAGGDGGTSDGPFQLHVGGGLGDIYQRIYGRSIHDKSPQAVKDQIDFALGMARKNGWGAWHGAANSGIGSHQGIGTYHGPVPHVGPPPRQPREETHIHQIHMDGKVIATSVTRRQVKAARMANSIGAHDSYGYHFPPGGTMVGT